MQKQRIAWLGAGLMGRPMAQRLLQAGYPLSVFNRTRSRAEPLFQAGARPADSPQEALDGAEAAILMLTHAAAIRQTLLSGRARRALGGRTVIQMGTIRPDESLHIQERVLAAGGDYLEAPVLGSIAPARSGELIVMVGSTEGQFLRWRELLANFGSQPLHVGPVGQAAAMKLALNQLIASLMAAFSLSLGIVQGNGVPVDAFMQVLAQSPLFAPTFGKKLPMLLARDFAAPNFPLRLLRKDVRLCLHEAARLGLHAASLKGTDRILKDALDKGFGELDYSGMHNVISPPPTA